MVRLFPRTNRRRAAAAAAAAAGMLLSMAAIPFAQADDLQDRKNKVEKNLEDAHDHVDSSSEELRQATDALLGAQAELAEARAELARTQGELAAAQALDAQMQIRLEAAIARLNRARRDLDEGRAKVAEQEETLSAVVVAAYENGSPGLMGLSVVLNSQDPAELTSQLQSVQTLLDQQEALLGRLQAGRVLLTVQEAEIEEAKVLVAKERKAAAENLRRKELLEARARDAEAAVSDLVDLRGQARAAAQKAKNADLKELKKLEAERDRIEALIAAQAARGTGYTAPTGGSGQLAMPVDGRITSPYGWRTHPVWGYRSLHDGVDFGAACGLPVRATAPGRVLQRYYQSAWGNRVILDHGVRGGARLGSIYNHLSSWTVSAGEQVERGEIVGYVGSTGWSTGCHLHFTILENGRAVDPMTWL